MPWLWRFALAEHSEVKFQLESAVRDPSKEKKKLGIEENLVAALGFRMNPGCKVWPFSR